MCTGVCRIFPDFRYYGETVVLRLNAAVYENQYTYT